MSFLGFLLLVAALFVLQVGTAWPGTPGACKPPGDDESGAAQLPPQVRAVEPEPPVSVETNVGSAGTLGYRVPLVVRQRVPAQIRGGVYMPAHETYVVLQPGHWELGGAAEDVAPAAASEPVEKLEVGKGCWLRRLFRKLGQCDGGS